jgi:DNA-binding MarR family transcriptional regulator
MNNKDIILDELRTLGLTTQEGRLYLELLQEPSTHLRLAHATGINRTKVYRLVDDMEKRGLIVRQSDDRGTFLVAAEPSTLEIALVNQEEKLARQKDAYRLLLPTLTHIKADKTHSFTVHTYEGIEGFKQMLWHELKAKGENLIFGGCPIESLVPDGSWAEKHRALTVQAGYTVRELDNPGDKDQPFTQNEAYMEHFSRRKLAREVLNLVDQVSIYNDTVATYHWRLEQKVGFEVVSQNYAAMMRQVFEQYWNLSTD